MRVLRNTVAALAAVNVLLVAAPIAHAALIPVDLLAPGDALLTRDTNTGLDWLDLTQTDGLSYAQVAGGSGGWIGLGFGFANVVQVQTLFTDAGIVTGTTVPENYPGTTLLISLLGQTSSGPSGEQLASGFADQVPFSATHTGYGGFGVFGSSGSATIFNGPFYPKTFSSPSMGVYMVRSAVSVPEPATLALLGVALAGLGFARRRKLHCVAHAAEHSKPAARCLDGGTNFQRCLASRHN